MEMNKDDNKSEKSELFASWTAAFATAFACFAALPLGLRAGWELDLTPTALACVLAGSWSLGVAMGGYASMFWKRLHTRMGRAMLLIAAAWAAAGLCSIESGGAFLVLLGVVGMISAALFAAQFRHGPRMPAVLTSTIWALAGVVAALMLMPTLFERLANMGLGTVGGWRAALMLPPVVLILTAIAGFQLTRPSAEIAAESESTDLPESLPAMAAAA